MHILGQAVAAQLHHRLHQRVRIAAAEEEEVALPVVQPGGLPLIDGVGVADDGGLLRLTEHLRQRDGGDHAAAEHIPQHAARPHGGQLVGVAHQHKAAAGTEGFQQGAHQLDVHHADLVHDDGVRLQRLLRVLLEGGLAGKFVIAHAESAVDGLRLLAAQLAHALGGAPRRRAEQHVQPHAAVQRDDAPEGRGLAGAGTAGQQQDAAAGRQQHRLTL